MPQLFDGVASNRRMPFRLGTALESIQKYAAGAASSIVNKSLTIALYARNIDVVLGWKSNTIASGSTTYCYFNDSFGKDSNNNK